LKERTSTAARRATDSTDIPGSWISGNLGEDIATRKAVGGSDWSNAYIYETTSGSKYFVKVTLNRSIDMFSGEAQGLEAMRGGFLLS